MAEKEFEEKGKMIFDTGWYRVLLKDRLSLEKYGLRKKELEKEVQSYLKFKSSFETASDYLKQAVILLDQCDLIECGHFIEKAKYVLRGCKD